MTAPGDIFTADGSGASVPARRREALSRVLAALDGPQRIALTTHVNADGDGTGSQVALATWLAARGKQVTIVNPTRFPDMFRFLVDDDTLVADAGTAAGEQALNEAELLVVLDTAEASRIGRVARSAAGRPMVVIDHHVAAGNALAGAALIDATACATGELVYDLLLAAGVPRPWPRKAVDGIYTAIVTDTGSFRFANTTRRAHAIAGELIADGVDPEVMYRRIYATVPLRRLELLRHALEQLEVDEDHAITWITIDRETMERIGAATEDLE
ncbi:MAG TPA: DHH family phosphoesterase, partial [Longimicrobiales bacterium]|nr:DHH family phosphoesterase [Longimicrobiales bacterium]